MEQSLLQNARKESSDNDITLVSTLSKSTNEPRSPKRLTVCGFLPLPSITASPICSPTSSLTSQSQGDSFYSAVCTSGESTPETNASSCSAMCMAFPPPTPTWIATPPTPPSKALRRSNTATTRRSRFTPFSPSASFPASTRTRAARNITEGLKRCTSVPAFSSRDQPTSPGLSSFINTKTIQNPRDGKPLDATLFIANGNPGPKCEQRAGSHPTPIFHLSNSAPVTDNEDDSSPYDKSNNCLSEIASPEGSWSDHSIDDIWETERNKDALRKFHALKELLATEVGYLMDLKALVTVYLRNLPTLAARPSLTSSSTFGRASSSFTNGPWIHSYTQLQAAALSSSATLPETPNALPAKTVTPKEPKFNSRYLFTDNEIESLTRNAEEILQLHEHFVRELRAILEPLSFTMDEAEDGHHHLETLDAAIRAVSTKFATEASRFNAYQSFCAGHPEALDILRKTYQQHPMELDAFEHRCAAMVADMLDTGTKPAKSEPRPNSSCGFVGTPSDMDPSQTLTVEDRKRTMSLTSLDGTVRSLRPHSNSVMSKDSVVFPTETKRETTSRRIAFADYLIKPIQRICKYPLLLNQLLPSKALRTLSQNTTEARSDIDVVVESAAQAMRHVATSVDEARHRQDIAIQSSLIFSRMCLGATSVSSSTPASIQMLSLDFLSSLGNCLLSGSLDVMHYHPNSPLGHTSNIKAKYLGAFLYDGGYLILVKVCKGRKYEPRHWFSLLDFEVSDVEDDGAMLPCSFRLSSGEQHFELAAACKREKDAWLSSIHKSLVHVPTWTNEPTPSYKFDDKGELLPGSEDGHSESPSGLQTIRSIPELCNTSETECTEPFFASLRGGKGNGKKRRGCETPLIVKRNMPPPPSRRSSSTSVKAIFSPMTSDTETVVIRRSSPMARLQVDQELQDVISQSCLTARSYAFSHEEELFQAPKAPKPTRSGFSRSNSSMSMAGMGRLSKHESVRVPRRRTTESLESLVSKKPSPLNAASTFSRRNTKKLSLTSMSLNEYDRTSSFQNIYTSPCPSPPSSQSSSRMTSLRAPGGEQSSLPMPPTFASPESSPIKPRSFVRNVKGLFQLRPVSPVSPVSAMASPDQMFVNSPTLLSDQTHTPNQKLPRWTMHSLRRRARSVTDEPDRIMTIFDDPQKPYPITPSRATTPLST
ncbi:hypothetical protein B0H34DRAFT_647537 [Crassisporium funariophilum]|nr:hypothetical protein B0H34DRAFT_647537 [Crassisporium funariophilum]